MRSLAPLSCLGLFLLSIFGCTGREGSGGDPLAPATALQAPALTAGLAPDEHLTVQWELTVDPGGAASLTSLPERATQAANQGRYYDLDISRFLSDATLQIAGVRRDLNGDLLVRVAHRHPFRAPNFSAPMTAANRADLSYTGKLLVLGDNEFVSFQDGDLRADPSLLRNPDGYAFTGDLLYRGGYKNNLFPYMLLVDEARDNRIGISNGAVPQGNYDISAAGWNRTNAGTAGDAWTGFDVLHAGQRVEVELALPADRLADGPLRVALAILIKYTDPRGTPDFTGRFPVEPPDAVAFSYRMPHGAFDGGRCQSCTDLQILNTSGAEAKFQVRVRDFDSLGADTPDETLWDNPAPDTILPGAGVVPIVEVEAPGLMQGIAAATRIRGSGLPGDELLYEGTVTRDEAAADPGTYYALIAVKDPESASPGYAGQHSGVDPVTLAASTARALPLMSYEIFPIEVLASQGWVRASDTQASNGQALDIGPDGSIAIAYYSHTGTVDVDPGPCVDYRVPNANLDIIVSLFDRDGNAQRSLQFAGSSADLVTGLHLDSEGGLRVVGASQSPDLDFDPGPNTAIAYDGTHRAAFVAQYRANHELDFVHFLATGPTSNEQSSAFDVLTDDTGAIYVSGHFTGTDLDFDPSGGEDLRSTATFTVFLSKCSASGDVLWTRTWNESGGATPYALTMLTGNRLAIGGTLVNTFDLDPTSGTQLHTPVGQGDAWFAVLDQAGAFEWAAAFGGTVSEAVASLVQHPATQRIYTSGNYAGTVDFDPGPGTTTRTAVAGSDCYVSLFSDAGVWDQVLVYGGAGIDSAWFADMAADGTFLIAGDFTGTIDFDPGPGMDNATSQGSFQDAYLWRLDSALTYLGATVVGGAGFESPSGAAWSATGKRPTILVGLDPGADLDPGPAVMPYAGGRAALVQYASDGSW